MRGINQNLGFFWECLQQGIELGQPGGVEDEGGPPAGEVVFSGGPMLPAGAGRSRSDGGKYGTMREACLVWMLSNLSDTARAEMSPTPV